MIGLDLYNIADDKRVKEGRNLLSDPVTEEEGWMVKSEEARKSGLTDSVRNEGVVHPVALGRVGDDAMNPDQAPVADGHHRLAAAAEVNPNGLISVVHTDSPAEIGRYSPEDDDLPTSMSMTDWLNFGEGHHPGTGRN